MCVCVSTVYYNIQTISKLTDLKWQQFIQLLVSLHFGQGSAVEHCLTAATNNVSELGSTGARGSTSKTAPLRGWARQTHSPVWQRTVWGHKLQELQLIRATMVTIYHRMCQFLVPLGIAIIFPLLHFVLTRNVIPMFPKHSPGLRKTTGSRKGLWEEKKLLWINKIRKMEVLV